MPIFLFGFFVAQSKEAHALELSSKYGTSCDNITFTDLRGYDKSEHNFYMYNTESGVYLGFPSGYRNALPSVGDDICYKTDNDTAQDSKRRIPFGRYSILLEGPPYDNDCGDYNKKYQDCKTGGAFVREVIFEIRPERFIREQLAKEANIISSSFNHDRDSKTSFWKRLVNSLLRFLFGA